MSSSLRILCFGPKLGLSDYLGRNTLYVLGPRLAQQWADSGALCHPNKSRHVRYPWIMPSSLMHWCYKGTYSF